MAVKERVTELISNVQSCTTTTGVDELEKLYKKKLKELGNDITPMMDIMVRDAIVGKRSDLEALAAEGEIPEVDAPKKVAPKDQLKEQKVDIVDFCNLMAMDIQIDEQSTSTAVFTLGRMNPPTKAHLMLMQRLSEVADKVGGLGQLWLSHTEDNNRNPLPYGSKVRYVKNILPENVAMCASNERNLFSIVESLAQRFDHIYAVVGADRVDEFKRAGRYFMREGGASFTVVNVGERMLMEDTIQGMSSTKARLCVEQDNYAGFSKIVATTGKDTEEMFEEIQGRLSWEE